MFPGAGAVAGALGGIAGHRKAPPKYNPVTSGYQNAWLADGNDPTGDKKRPADMNLGYFSEDFNENRGFLKDRMAGQSLFDDEARMAMLNPGRGNIAAQAAAARKRAQERATGLGIGPRSGMLEESLNQVDLSEVGALRGLQSDWTSMDARSRAAAAMAASAQLQGLLMGDQGFRQDEERQRYAAKVARSQAPSMWQSILGGAAAGFLGSDLPASRTKQNSFTEDMSDWSDSFQPFSTPGYMPSDPYGFYGQTGGYEPDPYGFGGAFGRPTPDRYGFSGRL